jgi:phosphatidylglycerol lysyltransferase
MNRIKSIVLNSRTKLIFQIFFALIPIALAVYFIKHQGNELSQAINLIASCKIPWLIAGITVTVCYILILGKMYSSALKTIQAEVTYSSALLLILKRNFISIFLPAGGLASLAFFTGSLEKQGVSKTRIHLASSIYSISAFSSLIIISIPAILILLLAHKLSLTISIAFIILLVAVIISIFILRSFLKGGWAFQIIKRIFPKIVLLYEELRDQHVSLRQFLKTILYSFLIELCGITHLYITMKVLGLQATVEIALIGYVVATLLMVVSPFMRGLGAVEIVLTITLVNFGMTNVNAISVTLIYRLLEFWLVLFTGGISFLYKRDNFFLRVFPAFLVFILGMVNIFSVLTPAIAVRVKFIEEFMPAGTIYLSNYAVIIAGIILIVLSAFLMRGLKNAWRVTLLIIFISVLGHLTKAIDYEEAIFGIIVGGLLLYTHNNYRIMSDRKLLKTTWIYLISGLGFIIVYGVVGFYFIDVKHYNLDFTFKQSFYYLINTAFLFNNGLLNEQTEFARWFSDSLNFLGASYLVFLLFVLLKPSTYRKDLSPEESELAKQLVEKNGRSSLDYFKVYTDKLFYFSQNRESFISYKLAGNYAVVLETPVCPREDLIPEIVDEFDKHCAENSLRTLYYRVDEKHIPYFESLNKKALFIGQEGLINVQEFSLAGGDLKPTRNILHKMEKNGFVCRIMEPPLKEGLIQKLKAVSDEWLQSFDKKESAFSGGVFHPAEIKQQVVLVVEDNEEKVVGFANMIPDFAPNEGTYDLIRKLDDAPHGVMDVLLVNMIEYFKNLGKEYLNVGLAPLSGIQKGKNLPERTIKFAYENLKQMQHYKGLRFFKEKYATTWCNKYLVYSNDYDLIQAPFMINRVSKYIA